MTLAGKACRFRVAGEGGRCASHPEIDPHAEAKARALEAARNGEADTLEDAAHAAGVERVQFWRWRKADPEFEEELQELLPSDEQFLEEWKGSAKKRAKAGEMSGTLEIWFIINLSRQIAKATGSDPDWQDLKHVIQTDIPLDFENLPDDALERIRGGQDPLRALAETIREARRVSEMASEPST